MSIPATGPESTARRKAVEAVEEALAAGEPLGGDGRLAEQGQVVAVELRGGVFRAEQAGAGGVVGLVLHRREEVDERGDDRVDVALGLRDDRAEMRRPEPLGVGHRLAGDVLPARMLVAEADHRAEDRHLVGTAGELRQQFAELDAGDDRRDRLELAADLGRGFG